MAGEPRHLIRTTALGDDGAVHVRHPLNPKSEVFIHHLSDRVGMKRAHLSLARVPPGKESFIPHSHSIQEEYLFIIDGEGTAEIGSDRVRIGPGDYLGFPTDGTTHHLINTGDRDLVYLMGGERTDVEVSRFPTLGKVAVMKNGIVNFYNEKDSSQLAAQDWIADRKLP